MTRDYLITAANDNALRFTLNNLSILINTFIMLTNLYSLDLAVIIYQ